MSVGEEYILDVVPIVGFVVGPVVVDLVTVEDAASVDAGLCPRVRLVLMLHKKVVFDLNKNWILIEVRVKCML